ncbi:MAG: alpha-galactosidase [Lachnospiraceae bacterium]
MGIYFSEVSGEFHLFNKKISYIIRILENGQLGNLYYGKVIDHQPDFSYLLEGGARALAVYTKENHYFMSPQYTKMEYPDFGRGDFREPAYVIRQENGSRISNFVYKSHCIFAGKKKLEGLPAVYTEEKSEAETLEILLEDSFAGLQIIMSYTLFSDYPVIARSVRFLNCGQKTVYLERALSACVDLPDASFEMVQLSGAWSRERYEKKRKLQQGLQGIGSRRGASSAEHNPFLILKREHTDDFQGEAYAFSLIYSGNHVEQVEVDTNDMTRVLVGIHSDGFDWRLRPGENFQTPEALLVYTCDGLNCISQTLHHLFANRLVRGIWRNRERPILINNWEATGAAFNEQKILDIARTAQELGIEMFVLDDGWFGKRDDDRSGLGDWYVTNFEKLPGGISGLAKKIVDMGMKFGLWFEPEMVNRDSDLYRRHPDWILCAPGRMPSLSRNQYVLDFSRKEVTDYVFDLMDRVINSAPISYIKWDMNRYITECYSMSGNATEQGMVYHRYILGVYALYERLRERYPDILFESCASGGARFDPGMLYYAPQTWTSDDTDAYERIKIQYGTSYVYPVSSMGAHVSAVPEREDARHISLKTRINVAMFGSFGYELDLSVLSAEEKKLIKKTNEFYKRHRKLFQYGDFYRLKNPFEGNDSAWMTVNKDKTEAMAGFYRMHFVPNGPWTRLRLTGLDPHEKYVLSGRSERCYYGSELMNAGIVIDSGDLCGGDFSSVIYHVKKC